VLAGSPADRDGRIQKGDRILSINGRSMKGVTHRESLNILKVLTCVSVRAVIVFGQTTQGRSCNVIKFNESVP
jgi:C-terminal processing protease CtpA/Prc